MNATGIDLNKGTRYRFSLIKPLNVFDARSMLPHLMVGLVVDNASFFSISTALQRPIGSWFALIGSVDKKYNFRISHNGLEITAPATGEVFCYFNDIASPRFYRNNQGTAQLLVNTSNEVGSDYSTRHFISREFLLVSHKRFPPRNAFSFRPRSIPFGNRVKRCTSPPPKTT